MNKQKDNMFTTTLQRVDDRMIYVNPADEKLYKLFVDHLEQGQTAEVFFDANKDDGRYTSVLGK
jgi:hypothetical protein